MPPGPNSPSLPAAQTTVMPCFHANSTAEAIGSYSTGAATLLPIERLITLMWYWSLWTTAHSTADMTAEARPCPVASSTLRPMMSAAGATPRNCTSAYPPWSSGNDAVPSPAMTPATNVPCPASSYGCFLSLTKSFQATIRLLWRSGDVVATPLSTTATPTPAPEGPPAAGAVDPVEADREVGDIERAGVVEPEDRVVRDDEIDGVARGERVDLILRQICGDGVEVRKVRGLDAGGDGILLRRRRLLGLYRR